MTTQSHVRTTGLDQAEFSLELGGLQSLFDSGQEPGGVCPIDEPMIVRQRQVHHGARNNDLAEAGIGDDGGRSDDSPRSQMATCG